MELKMGKSITNQCFFILSKSHSGKCVSDFLAHMNVKFMGK